MALQERFLTGLRARVRRVTTSHVSPPVRIVLAAAHLLAALLCVVILTGWRGPAVINQLTGMPYWPWQSLLTMVALGLIAVTLSMGAVRSTLAERAGLSAVVFVVSLFVADALPLSAMRPWWTAGAILCTSTGLLLPGTRATWDWVRCVLVLAPFVAAFWATATASDSDQALVAIRALVLAPSAAMGLSLLAIFAAASAVEDHRERSENLLTWRVTVPAVRVAVGLKLALLVALYMGFTGDFLGGEAMWRPRLDQPLSWVHAALVAGSIATVAVLSTRQPLEPKGFMPRLAVLTLCLGVMQVAALLTLVAIIIVHSLLPTADATPLFQIPGWVVRRGELVQLCAVAVLLVAAVATVSVRRRLSLGTYLWLIAGIWLLPPLLGIAFATEDSPTAWAAPGQVDAVLTLVVLAMVLARRPAGVSPRTLMSLVIIPVVVLHLETFWPDRWTQGLIELAVVVGVASALWVNPPAVYTSERRNERVRALLLAGNLTILVLYIYLFNDASLAGGLESSTTFAWLWLGVPITAVLTARVARPAPQRAASGSAALTHRRSPRLLRALRRARAR